MTLSLRSTVLLAMVTSIALTGCERGDDRVFQGWVEAELIFVGPDETGRLENLSVRQGQTVTEGAPLFVLDKDLQQANVRAAEATVAEAEARLARAEAQQQRPQEIAVLEAQERRAEAMLQLSTAERERQLQLAAKGVTSKAQLDTAESNYMRDMAALEEIRRQIKVARLSARKEDIAAARETLAQAQARLASAKTRLARREVVSPVSGVVQKLYFRTGEMVAAGRPVVSLLPPANMKLRFFVPQPRRPDIAIGEPVQVRCDGCEEQLAARIDFISQTAEFTPPVVYTPEERAKLVFLVEARPAHPERLRVGQPVRVVLPLRAAKP
jgi:HlyD family secretion protein